MVLNKRLVNFLLVRQPPVHDLCAVNAVFYDLSTVRQPHSNRKWPSRADNNLSTSSCIPGLSIRNSQPRALPLVFASGLRQRLRGSPCRKRGIPPEPVPHALFGVSLLA